jgi:hypothetical protein
MHPFRIAILIFFVGASVVNYLAVKEYRDRISPVTTATVTPLGVPTDASGHIDWSKVKENDAQRDFSGMSQTEPYVTKLEAAANDKAWMREAVIVTIAGIVWFLVPAKAVH